MPELKYENARLTVAAGENLLDALLRHGIAVPHGCRAGSCGSCLVRCLSGEVSDRRPEILGPQRLAAGWHLACQCRVAGDLTLEIPSLAAERPARVAGIERLGGGVLGLRLLRPSPLPCRPGQWLTLRSDDCNAELFVASMAGETALAFHLSPALGGFYRIAERMLPGDSLNLGEPVSSELHYDPAWAERPLLLVGEGIGLAPLWAIARQALAGGHEGGVELRHFAGAEGHYLAGPLRALAAEQPRFSYVEATVPGNWRPARQSLVLLCGSEAFVEAVGRQLYLAGVARSQIFSASG